MSSSPSTFELSASGSLKTGTTDTSSSVPRRPSPRKITPDKRVQVAAHTRAQPKGGRGRATSRGAMSAASQSQPESVKATKKKPKASPPPEDRRKRSVQELAAVVPEKGQTNVIYDDHGAIEKVWNGSRWIGVDGRFTRKPTLAEKQMSDGSLRNHPGSQASTVSNASDTPMTPVNRAHQPVVVDLTRGDWPPRAPSPKSPRLTRSDAQNLVSSKGSPALPVFERRPPQEVYQVNSADILRTVQTERKGIDTQEQFTVLLNIFGCNT
jgi:hypothetical protein